MTKEKGARKLFVHNTHIGQNFLVDRSVLRTILEQANLVSGDVVLEVGPGQGVLSKELLSSPCLLVHAVEIDRRLEPFLKGLDPGGDRFLLQWGDAVRFDYSSLVPAPNRVIANIPYHITTPLIWKLLEDLAPLGMVYLLMMVQKEAADRICARPATKERYPLGITLEAMGHCRTIRRVPPAAFHPRPRVDSALLEIRIEGRTSLPADGAWRKLVSSAFSQRRKTFANNLWSSLGIPREETVKVLASKGLKDTVRAEEIETADWLDLLEKYRTFLE